MKIRLLLLSLIILAGESMSAQLVLQICTAQLPCPGFPLGSVQAGVDQNGWRNFKVTLTQNVSLFSIVGTPPPSQASVNVIFTQDATGGRTVTFASNITNPCTIATGANATTLCQFEFDGIAGIWFGIAGGGGTSRWNAITAANGTATFANTTFNTTLSNSASTNFFAHTNTTTATNLGVNQSSPTFNECGNYFFSGASAQDCWNFQDVISAGTTSTTVTNVSETSGSVVTLTITGGTLLAGQQATFTGLTTATWLNNQNVFLTTATATQLTFTDPTSHGTQASAAETGQVTQANPLSAFTVNHSGSGNSASQIMFQSGEATFGGTTYPTMNIGQLSVPGHICGVTGASSYPPSPVNGYGYAVHDVCPAIFTAPAPVVSGISSQSIMGVNVSLATAFSGTANVFAINGQLASPTSTAGFPGWNGNQTDWNGYYHESDWRSPGTLTISFGAQINNYNSGNGTIGTNVGIYTEAVNGQSGGVGGASTGTTGTITSNTGLEVKTGVNSSGATNTGDTGILIDIPYVAAGSVFTNGHTGLQINDQTANGALNPNGGTIYAFKINGEAGSPNTGAYVDLGRGKLIFDNSNVFVDGTTSGELNLVRPVTTNTGPIGYPNPASSGVCSGGQPCQMLASSNVETAGPGGSGNGAASSDSLWPDSTSHRWLMDNNNAGVDNVGDTLVQSCGTTSTCSHSALLKPQIVIGTVALVSGSPSTATITGISPAFTSTSSFNCTANDTTTITNAVKCVPASASSISCTGANTVTDTISYICAGN